MPSQLVQGDTVGTVTLSGGEFLLVTASGVLRNNPTTVEAGGTGVDIDVQGLIFSTVNAIQVEGRNIAKPIPWDAQMLNSGSIIGRTTGIAGFDFGILSLTNDGIVRGGSDGVNLASIDADGDDVFLVNNGTITGSDGINMIGLFVP